MRMQIRCSSESVSSISFTRRFVSSASRESSGLPSTLSSSKVSSKSTSDSSSPICEKRTGFFFFNSFNAVLVTIEDIHPGNFSVSSNCFKLRNALTYASCNTSFTASSSSFKYFRAI